MKEFRDKNRLWCNIEKPSGLFFSLVDYRNTLFTSNNPEDIIKFYDGFHNRDDLIEWMKERPKGASYIHEVEGDKDIIVVIPTADFDGKYARNCREEIFKGLHIIFVESGGRGDFYFNYAHNCNVGIKKALEYNPKWIVVSNDDMYKIDDVSVLRNSLKGKDNKRLKAVFTRPSEYHSEPVVLMNGPTNAVFVIYFLSYIYDLIRNGRKNLFANDVSRTTIYWRIGRRFNIKWDLGPPINKLKNFYEKFYRKMFYREVRNYILTSDFTIISGKWVKERSGKIFNETYINGAEDWETSLLISKNREDYDFIDYDIGDIIGGTLGKDPLRRTLRDISNKVYFNMRYGEELALK